MELTNDQVLDLFARLGSIEAKVENLAKPGAICAVHTSVLADMKERLESVENQQGKQNLIAVTLGAIGAAIVLTVKYVAGRA